MNLFGSLRLVWLLGMILALVLWIPAASAQSDSSATSSGPPASPDPSDDGWHFSLTPYLWFSGIHGTLGVKGHDASVHASASDVLSNFDIGFMIAAEPRYGRIVFPIDYMWVKLSDSKALPFAEGYYSVKATATEGILTQKVGYRFIDQPKFKADALFGYRFWYLTNSFALQPVSPFGGLSDSAGWVDAVAGGRFELALGKKAFVTVFGDAGGATAKYDYQVGGLLGFRVAKQWDLEAGYRYLAVDYGNPSHFLFNVAQSGVVIGATWTPK